MLYNELFSRMEAVRWNLQSDIPWDRFDASKITPRQLHGIKMNAILEWSAMPTAEMFLRDNQADTDFSAFISVWFFEEQKHSLTLLEYLRRFAPEYCPTETELAAVRFDFDTAPPLETLALHFCGEIRLTQWYRCAMKHHQEPVIQQIYKTLAGDEARHARAYYRYMERAIARDGDIARLAFAKIGVLMTNARLTRAMHPTNLHVNASLYPEDTVNSKLPDPSWLEAWLSQEICFDALWEQQVVDAILRNYSQLLGVNFDNAKQLRNYRKSLQEQSVALSA